MMEASARSRDIRIAAIGTYLPLHRLVNEDLIARFEITPEFLQAKLGFLSRALKSEGETTTDLCVRAFADLAASVPSAAEDIELVCVVTQNPDQRIPHTAAIVQQRLGIGRRCMTFDISQGCAGYVHGLAVVHALMTSFRIERALLFTSDPYSKIVDPADRDTALLFGDAATVTLLSRTDEPGYSLVDADFGTAPDSHAVLTCKDRFQMDGRGVFLHALRAVPQSVCGLLARNQRSLDDVDLFLFHPGSKHMVDALRRELRLDEARLPFEAADYGNTVSSSIPLMLAGRLAAGPGRILLSGFGVGFSWGSCLLEARGT